MHESWIINLQVYLIGNNCYTVLHTTLKQTKQGSVYSVQVLQISYQSNLTEILHKKILTGLHLQLLPILYQTYTSMHCQTHP